MSRGTTVRGSGHSPGKGTGQKAVTAPRNSLGTAVVEIYRGRVFLSLLRDLALAEWSYSEIAQGLGLPTSDIAAFAEENSEEIAEVKKALAGELALETAGLWIAQKKNRIAELQGDYEDTDREIQAIRKSEPTLGEHGSGPGSKHHRELIRTRSALLRAVAEELGDHKTGPKPADVSDKDAGRVHYAIEVPPHLMEALS